MDNDEDDDISTTHVHHNFNADGQLLFYSFK